MLNLLLGNRAKSTFGIVAVTVYLFLGLWLLVIFVVSLWTVTEGLLRHGYNPPSHGGASNTNPVENLRNIGLILGAFFGIPAFLWRLLLTADGQITDRFSRAVDQLSSRRDDGEPNIEARVGALHALNRISRDSLTDHLAVAATICAYVRENTIIASQDPGKPDPADMRLDVDTALLVLFDQRSKNLHKVERQKNFSCDLGGLFLPRARLTGAKLWYVDFEKTDLRESKLFGADLTNACLVSTDLRGAKFGGCCLDGSMLKGADLSTAEGLRLEMLETAYGVKSGKQESDLTILPDYIPDPPTHWYDYQKEVRERGEEARSYIKAYNDFLDANVNQPSKYW